MVKKTGRQMETELIWALFGVIGYQCYTPWVGVCPNYPSNIGRGVKSRNLKT